MKKYRNKLFAALLIAASALTGMALTIGADLAVIPAIWTNAIQRTLGSHLRDNVEIFDYIPTAEIAAIRAHTSGYDVSSALTNAVADCPTQGCKIHFPYGRFKFNSTIELKKPVTLQGESAGPPTSLVVNATRLSFANDITAIIVHSYNTIGSTVESPTTTSAAGASIRGMRIDGGGTTGDGIWCRALCDLEDLNVASFGRDGIHIEAQAGAGGALEGNANGWFIKQVVSQLNGRHGFFIEGDDSNAGTALAAGGSTNGGYGIYDSSFLGNTWLSCTSADNVGGAIYSDGTSARNMFVNCYTEGGQPASTILAPSQIIGGLHSAGFLGGATAFAWRIIDQTMSGVNNGGSVAVDPPSLATLTKTTTATFTSTCNLSDFIQVSFSVNLAGVQLYAWCSAANTISYYFFNPTAGAVDVASGVAYFVRSTR